MGPTRRKEANSGASVGPAGPGGSSRANDKYGTSDGIGKFTKPASHLYFLSFCLPIEKYLLN